MNNDNDNDNDISVVQGGQGRTPEELACEAAALSGFAVGCVLTAILLTLGYLVWR